MTFPTMAAAPAGTLAATPPVAASSPIHAAQHTFRMLLSALATPGTLQQLVVHGAVTQAGPVGNPWLASALLTLLDHEVSLAVAPLPAREVLVDLLHRRTRTPEAEIETADYVVAALATLDPDWLERLKRGSLQYPDDAATLCLLVDSLTANATGATLTLRGPGVAAERTLPDPGFSDALLAARERVIGQYPMGIDLFVIDAAGQVIGLPRTTELSRRGGA